MKRLIAVAVMLLSGAVALAGDKNTKPPRAAPKKARAPDFCAVMAGGETGMYDDPSDCRDGKVRKVYCSGGKAVTTGPCQ